MKIELTKIRKWKSQIEHGDLTKIAFKNKLSRKAISSAINNKHAHKKTIEAIDEYLKSKV